MAAGTVEGLKPPLEIGHDVRWGLRHSRLRIPSTRTTDVVRESLLVRLSDPSALLINVVAPPGYGKTTLLAQYASSISERTAWLSVGEDCNDPIVLVRYLAIAFEPYVPIGPDLLSELDAVNPRSSILEAGLGEVVRGVPAPFLLVIDDVDHLTDPSATDLIRALVEEAQAGIRVALSGLHQAKPFGLSQATQGLLEIGPNDLAFGEDDAVVLFRNVADEDIEGSDASAVMDRTEGWPAAVYLAALSHRGADRPNLAIAEAFHGDDRYIVDFFREAVLTRLPPEQVDFLIRTAVLDELSGPLCDAILDTSGSGTHLEELDDANLFLVPLDHRRERYRYHYLFREWLLMELRHRTPDLEKTPTARASASRATRASRYVPSSRHAVPSPSAMSRASMEAPPSVKT